jgi:PAS domain S-box-containing protein
VRMESEETGVLAKKEKRWLYLLSLAGAWSLLIGLSLAWNLWGIRHDILSQTRVEARAALEKDMVYRMWTARQGGVYVPVSADTPPNALLADIEERDIQTPSGRLLTLVNPAYMTRLVHETGREIFDTHGHITSLDPIRPENAPDPWETEALKAFEDGEEEFSAIEEIGGEPYMRLMRGLVVEESCLKCHGAQGYEVGDIRGGLSVAVPMAPYWASAPRQTAPLLVGHVLAWFFGLTGIAWSERSIRRRERARVAVLEKLRASEDRYAQAQRAAQIGSWEWNVATRELQWSEQLEPMFGFNAGEFGGTYGDFIDSIHPEDRSLVVDSLDAALKNEKNFAIEHRIVWPDGTLRWMSEYGALQRDSEGNPLRMFGVAQDITPRKRTEQTIREMALFSELNPSPALRFAPQGAMISCNKATVEVFGQDYIARASFSKLFPDLNLEECVQAGAVSVTECEVDDQWFQFVFHGVPDLELAHVYGSNVTQRKKAELALAAHRDKLEEEVEERTQALRESELLLRSIVDGSTTYIFIKDLDGKHLLANRGFEEAFNLGKGEILGKTDAYVFSEETAAARRRDDLSVLTAGHPVQIEEEAAVQGELRWYLTTKFPLYDTRGKPYAVCGMATDITGRKQMEEALKDSEAQYRKLYEATSDAVALVDENGFCDCNSAMLALFGCSSVEAFCALHLADLSPRKQADGRDSRAVADEKISAAFQAGRLLFEWSSLRLNGIEFSSDVLLTAMELSGKKTLLCVIRDITERIRSKQALEENESRLQQALEGANAGTLYLDIETSQLLWDDRTCRIYGISQEEFGGDFDAWAAYVHEEDLPAARQAFGEMLDDPIQDKGQMEYRIIRPSGEVRVVLVAMRFIRNQEGEAKEVSGLHFDVTEQRSMENLIRLRLAREKLVSRVSSRFVSLPAEEMDVGIDQSLGEVGGFLKVDRAYVFLYDKVRSVMNNTHEWCAKGVSSEIDDLQNLSISEIPWWYKQTNSKPFISISRLSELPEEAGMQRKRLEEQGIQSILTTPILEKNKAVGFLGLDSVRTERRWTTDEIYFLQVISNTFSNAFGRWKGEEEVRKYAARQEALVREVNHRVKNNLSALSSLLHLEKSRAESDPSALNHILPDLEGRIQGLSVVHDVLSAGQWRPVSLYKLCSAIVGGALASIKTTTSVTLDISSCAILVDSGTAHHLALVLNELATNTVKHGLKNQSEGGITIRFEDLGGRVVIDYRDNGPGFPEAILLGERKAGSIGTELLEGIVEHTLRGRLERHNDGGAVTRILFDSSQEEKEANEIDEEK